MTNSRIVVLLCALLVAVSAFGATARLEPGDSIATNRSYASLVADFNGDNLDDLLISGKIHFNRGGSFGAAVTAEGIPSGELIRLAADLNGDGFADVIAAKPGSNPPNGNTVPTGRDRILLNNGTGRFTEGPRLPADKVQKVADINADGALDLIFLQLPQGIVLALGNGDGTFSPYLTIPIPDEHAGQDSFAFGDLDSDSRPDLVWTSRNYVYFYFAGEDGSFSEPVKRYTYLSLILPEIADVNGDAKADLVAISHGVRDSRLSVLFGDGTGRFPGVSHFSVPLLTENGYAHPRDFRIADFHANGANEIAVASADHIFMLSAVGDRLQELTRLAVPQQENFVSGIFTARMRPNAAPELISRGQSGPQSKFEWNLRVIAAEGEADAFPAPAKPKGRVRAVRGFEDLAVGTYDVRIESACPVNVSTTWTIRREGIFVNFDPILGVVGVDAAYIDGEVIARVFVLDNGRLRTLDGSLYSLKNSMKAIFTESEPPCGQTWVAHLVEGTRR